MRTRLRMHGFTAFNKKTLRDKSTHRNRAGSYAGGDRNRRLNGAMPLLYNNVAGSDCLSWEKLYLSRLSQLVNDLPSDETNRLINKAEINHILTSFLDAHFPYIHKVCDFFSKSYGLSYDDAFNYASHGAANAVLQFKDEKAVNVGSLFPFLRTSLINYLKKYKTEMSAKRRNIPETPLEHFDVGEIFSDHSKINEEDILALKKAISRLRPEQQDTIRMAYGVGPFVRVPLSKDTNAEGLCESRAWQNGVRYDTGVNLSRVARLKGVSPEAVRQSHNAALKNLREILGAA